jgi:hypothetical protein
MNLAAASGKTARIAAKLFLTINSRPRPHIIATMASKFMANAAFEARLLLRPSHQRTVWTVNKLKCPIPDRPTLPPILSSRSYSDSTSTPPFPKSSGSTEGSQSSRPKGKDWFSLALENWGLGAVLGTAGIVRTCTCRLLFMCQWKHADYQSLL